MTAQSPFPAAPAGAPVPPPGYPRTGSADLARRGTVLFILLFLFLMGVAFFVAPLFLLSGARRLSPAQVYNFFREGGFPMWGILLSQMFVWALTAALGALLIRGTRVPGSVLFILALLPFGLGVLGAIVNGAKVTGAISGASVDPSQKARILAMGIAELSNDTLYGGSVSAFAMYLVAVAAVLGMVTIDPAPLGPRVKSSAALVAGLAGLGAMAVSGVTRMAMHLDLFALDGLMLFGLLTSGLLAGAASRPIPALIAAGKGDEASRGFRQVALAAFALAAAMVLADRALFAASIRAPLDAIASMSVDPSQRVRILVGGVGPAERGRPVVMVVDALGCLAVFAAPLLAARGAGRKASFGGAAAAIVAALTAALALFSGATLTGAITAQRAPFEELDKALAASAITLPTVADGDGSGVQQLPRVPGLLVQANGSLVDQRSATGDEPASRTEVAADGSVTFAAFMDKAGAALVGKAPSRRIGFVLLPARRLEFATFSVFAGLLVTDLSSVPVTLHRKLADGLPAPSDETSYSYPSTPRRRTDGALAVLPDGDVGRLVLVNASTDLVKLGETWPLGGDDTSREARRRRLTSLHTRYPAIASILLAPAPGDTVARVVAELQAIASSRPLPTDALVVTADRATLEAAPAASEKPAPVPVPAPAPSSQPARRRPGR